MLLNLLLDLLYIQKSKKSQGHVEMVLSFVLFVGFLIFIFMFINPLIRFEEKSTINKEKDVIISKISENIGKVPVVVEDGYCYPLNEIKNRYGDKFIEKDEGTFSKDSTNYHRYTLYFFGDKTVDVPVCGSITENGGQKKYKIGTYSKEKLVLISKIIQLKGEYDNDYINLKKQLAIGDFSFSIKDLDGITVELWSVSKQIPKNTNVVSIDIPIKILVDMNDLGNKKSQFKDEDFREMILNIKKW